MSKLVPISEAASALGVSASTLRRWDASGRLVPARSVSGQRRYDLAALRPDLAHVDPAPRRTLAYARVSSHDQKGDLERQKQVLEMYCASRGWTFDLVADLGSGMNYHKKGLQRLLDAILAGEAGRLVVVHKDRLLRFGAELVFALCQAKQVEVVIINQDEDAVFQEELASDVLEIITVFSARLYGARSHRNRRLIEGVQRAVEEAQC